MPQEDKMIEALTKFTKAIESVQEPLKKIALLQCARELYPDHGERVKLVEEYGRLLTAHSQSIEDNTALLKTAKDLPEDQRIEAHTTQMDKVRGASVAVDRFSTTHPYIRDLYYSLVTVKP